MNQAAFDDMLDEWDSISRGRTVDLDGWQRAVETMVSEERALRSEGRWVHGRDDFFGVLGMTRAEIRHSRIIAWLLDPCARHGLGVRVLHGLIHRVFGSTDANRLAEHLFAARTTCEAPVDGGRLDIVVEAPGLYLVIENKVDAPEGDQQCDHYLLHTPRRDARFVLLSPDGRPPRSEDEGVRSAFKLLRYRDLAVILRSALTAVPPSPGRGRHIAEDYLRTLQKEFSHEPR